MTSQERDLLIRNGSADFQRLNGVLPSKPRAPKFTGAKSQAKAKSRLQQTFESHYHGPPLVAEYVFHPTRDWRLDLAHVPSKVAIEFHGGIWSGGRHVRGKGFSSDRDKMNSAQELGWIVFELCDVGGADDYARRVEQAIKSRTVTN